MPTSGISSLTGRSPSFEDLENPDPCWVPERAEELGLELVERCAQQRVASRRRHGVTLPPRALTTRGDEAHPMRSTR